MNGDAMQLSSDELDPDQANRSLNSGPSDAGGPSVDLGKVSQSNVLFHEYWSELQRELLRWAQDGRNIRDDKLWSDIEHTMMEIQLSIVKRRCSIKQEPLWEHFGRIRGVALALVNADTKIQTDRRSFVEFRRRLLKVLSMHYGLQVSLEPADSVILFLIDAITAARASWHSQQDLTPQQSACTQQVFQFSEPLNKTVQTLAQRVKDGEITEDARRIYLRTDCIPIFESLKDKMERMHTNWELNGLVGNISAKCALYILGLSTIGFEYCRSKPEMPDLYVPAREPPDGKPSYNNIAFYRDISLWGDFLPGASLTISKLQIDNKAKTTSFEWEEIIDTIASVTDRDACSVVEFSNNATTPLDLITRWAYGLRHADVRVDWLFPEFQAAGFMHDVWRLQDVFYCRGNYSPHFSFNECAWTLCRVLADLQIVKSQLQKKDTKVDRKIWKLGNQSGEWCSFVKDLVLGVVRQEVRALGAEERMQKIVDCLMGASSMLSSRTRNWEPYVTTRLKIEGLPGHLQQKNYSRVFSEITEIENNLRGLCTGYKHSKKGNFILCKEFWSLALCCECLLELNKSMNQTRSPTGSVLLLNENGMTKFNWVAELRRGNNVLKQAVEDYKNSHPANDFKRVQEVWSQVLRPCLWRTIQLLG